MGIFCLKGIAEAWNTISLGEKDSVDEVTVQSFETLAPCVNRVDRDVITSLMDTRIIFSKVQDQTT